MGNARLVPIVAPPRAVTLLLAAALASPPAQAQDQTGATDVSRLFATSCGFCHQQGGRVQGRGPKLMGTEKSDEDITKQIKNGKPPRMPAFGKNFSDDQIKAIVAYIRALK